MGIFLYDSIKIILDINTTYTTYMIEKKLKEMLDKHRDTIENLKTKGYNLSTIYKNSGEHVLLVLHTHRKNLRL